MISKNLVKYIIALIAIVALVLSIIAVAKKCKDKFGDTGCPPGVQCTDPYNPMRKGGMMQKWFYAKHGFQSFPHKDGQPQMVKYDVTKQYPFIPCYNEMHGICNIDLKKSNIPWIKSLYKYFTSNINKLAGKVIVPIDYANLDEGWKIINTPPPFS